MMRITDEHAWRAARQRALMLGYPRAICRFMAGLTLMLAATELTRGAWPLGDNLLPSSVLASFAGLSGNTPSADSTTAATLQRTLSIAVAECVARNRADESNLATQASSEDTDNRATTFRETNLTIDSRGRRWAFDQDTHRWKAVP